MQDELPHVESAFCRLIIRRGKIDVSEAAEMKRRKLPLHRVRHPALAGRVIHRHNWTRRLGRMGTLWSRSLQWIAGRWRGCAAAIGLFLELCNELFELFDSSAHLLHFLFALVHCRTLGQSAQRQQQKYSEDPPYTMHIPLLALSSW